jgi:hypothetical protein
MPHRPHQVAPTGSLAADHQRHSTTAVPAGTPGRPQPPAGPDTRRPTIRIVTDDTVAIHAYQVPAEALAAVLPLLEPPADDELLSRRLLGTAQRTADGWAVTTIHADTATVTDGAAALAAIVHLGLHHPRPTRRTT